MAKKADIGSKRLISLAPDAWSQWVTQSADVSAIELLDIHIDNPFCSNDNYNYPASL
jgi:hypothetical protein